MRTHPSKQAEFLVGVLLPPACREEVLGDLYERYRSPIYYFGDVLCTLPLVILSRIRRTSDVQIAVAQILGLYLSFLGAARMTAPTLLLTSQGLLRLTGPVIAILIAMVLADAYADPRRPSPFQAPRAPLAGVGLAIWSQVMLWAANSEFAIPWSTMADGCMAALLLSTGIRVVFSPAADQLRGVNAPAAWLKQNGPTIPGGLARVAKGIAPLIGLLLVSLVAYQVWKRAVP